MRRHKTDPRNNSNDRVNFESQMLKSFCASIAIALSLFLFTPVARGQNPTPASEDGALEAVATKKDLYPADADAKQEIAAAVNQAVAEKKRVMLVFGANWCYDCLVLDRALHEGSAGKVVQESFLVVHVDIGEGDKNLDLAKKYKIPIEKGVPAVAILDQDGKLLYSSGSGEFEAARSMMKKDLLAFLMLWKKQS